MLEKETIEEREHNNLAYGETVKIPRLFMRKYTSVTSKLGICGKCQKSLP